MTNQRLKKVRRASFSVSGLTKFWKESRKNCECYVSTKIQETNIVFSN